MKNSNDSIGDRTRDRPVCIAVPQPTAQPAACPRCRQYNDHKARSYTIKLIQKGLIKSQNSKRWVLSQLQTLVMTLGRLIHNVQASRRMPIY